MMYLKRGCALLLAVVLAASLGGCREAEEDIKNKKDAVPVAEPGQEPLPKGVLMPNEPGGIYSDEELKKLSSQQITWGPGSICDEQGRPEACTLLQGQYEKYSAWFLGPEEDKVYLTFDEGYENGYTAQMLDTLQEKQVKAVFFVTMDYVKREPELVQRMIDEGHEVGNHTTHHPNMTTLSINEGRLEIAQLHDYVQQQFGYSMSLFRAPEGAISEQSMALLQSMGYQNVLWSFAYHDWDVNHQMKPATALQRASERCHPGAIYLLHAVSETNAAILGDWIDAVRAQGYEFGSFNEEGEWN